MTSVVNRNFSGPSRDGGAQNGSAGEYELSLHARAMNDDVRKRGRERGAARATRSPRNNKGPLKIRHNLSPTGKFFVRNEGAPR